MSTQDLLFAILMVYLVGGSLRFTLPRLRKRWGVVPFAETDAFSGLFLIVVSVAMTLLAAAQLHFRFGRGGETVEPGKATVLAGIYLIMAMITGFLGVALFPSRSPRPGPTGTLFLVLAPLALVALGLYVLNVPVLS